MSHHTFSDPEGASWRWRFQPFLLLPLALCPIVLMVGPKLLLGALPVGISGLLVLRILAFPWGEDRNSAHLSPFGSLRPLVSSGVLVAFLGWAGLTILWSDRPDKSLDYWDDVALIIGFIVLALEVSRRLLPGRMLERFVLWTLIALTLTAGFTALNLATKLPLHHLLQQMGVITDSVAPDMLNRTLTFLVLTIWPFLGFLAVGASHRRATVWCGALIAFAVSAVLLGESASALVAMVIGGCGAIGALAMPPTLLRWGLRAILLVTVLAGPWLLTHVLPHAPRVADAAPPSAQHRIEILALYAHPLSERPLTGWGLLSATTVPKTPVPPGGEDLYRYSDPLTMTVHPHNNFVQIWIDLGVPGILLVTALGWLAVGWIARQPSTAERACATGACLSSLAVASTAYGVWQADWLAQIVFCVLLFRLFSAHPKPAAAKPHASRTTAGFA